MSSVKQVGNLVMAAYSLPTSPSSSPAQVKGKRFPQKGSPSQGSTHKTPLCLKCLPLPMVNTHKTTFTSFIPSAPHPGPDKRLQGSLYDMKINRKQPRSRHLFWSLPSNQLPHWWLLTWYLIKPRVSFIPHTGSPPGDPNRAAMACIQQLNT